MKKLKTSEEIYTMIERIRIVLCETSHPGNIGAVARAMKNMGLKKLILVNPEKFPCAVATERAAGADDILQHAEVATSLHEAVKDCELIFGTSARMREIPWPKVTPKQCAEKALNHSNSDKVAIVFGTERSGLTNEALSLCNFHLYIPANPQYEALNLSQAVQIICYEIYQHYMEKEQQQDALLENAPVPASLDDVMGVFEHLEQALRAVEFIDPKPTRILMLRLKRLLLKARLDMEDVNILRGVCKAIIYKVSLGETT